jgi:hypothetical protein
MRAYVLLDLESSIDEIALSTCNVLLNRIHPRLIERRYFFVLHLGAGPKRCDHALGILSAGCLPPGMGHPFRSMPARVARVGEAAIEVGDVIAG